MDALWSSETSAIRWLSSHQELFRGCCERIEFPAGLALQTYLRSAEEDAERLIEWARGAGREITVRLIKGAYWARR